MTSHNAGDHDIRIGLRQGLAYVTIRTYREMTTALLSEVGRGEVAAGPTIPVMPLSPQEVGARIARARDEKEPKPWSQFDLALAMGVSPSTIYRWEKGKLPSMHELIHLAEILDKPPDYLTEPPERQAEIGDLYDRLATLEGAVRQSVALTQEALELLREAREQTPSARRVRRSTG